MSLANGPDSAIVFGGGGVWGIAWMTGIAAGLADQGIDLRSADLFVGTSAGAAIATQLRGSLAIHELFERQAVPDKQAGELSPPPDCMVRIREVMTREWEGPQDRLRAICDLALATETVSVAERRASVADRLKPLADSWPAGSLLLTAVDTQTLELTVFDADSGVSLIDAVTASCAVPGVWPAVPIDGRLYVDGGVWRTPENAQLAAGASRVLILSPLGADSEGQLGPGLAGDIEELRKGGSAVHVVIADGPSMASMGLGPLDPDTRTPAALAGRNQGQVIAQEIEAFLSAG